MYQNQYAYAVQQVQQQQEPAYTFTQTDLMIGLFFILAIVLAAGKGGRY